MRSSQITKDSLNKWDNIQKNLMRKLISVTHQHHNITKVVY